LTHEESEAGARYQARGRRTVGRGQLAAGVILLSAASALTALTACAGNAKPTALTASPEVVAAANGGGGSAAGVGSNSLATSQPVFIQRAIAQGPSTPSPKVKPKHMKTPTPSASSNSNSTMSGSTPSGESPSTSLGGFTLKYLEQFDGSSAPANWDEYSGGDSGPQASDAEATFDPSMCQFSGGEAHFMASGTSTCGMHYAGAPQEYGAWFIRMKGDPEPGSGALFDDIMLLWPDATAWPPEIDIYEDNGDRAHTSEAMYNTVSACGGSPSADCLNPYSQGTALSGGISNDDDEWHTYGLVWTPSGVTWYIDGKVVESAPASATPSGAQQPATTMDLDLQVQSQGSGISGESDTMDVDWLEQFSFNG
jgi:Glycosyl hydrolases family 16